MDNNKNFILAIVLSLAVFAGWQYFYVRPIQQQRVVAQQEIEARQKEAKASQSVNQTVTEPTNANTPSVSTAPQPAEIKTREEILQAGPRIKIDTPSLTGSISLKGGRIDDVVLRKYTQTVDPKSEQVVLFSPSGTQSPYYAELGWLAEMGVKVPGDEAVWSVVGTGVLTPSTPVVLKHDNGQGLVFQRTISIDDGYMFKIVDEVQNNTGKTISLRPYGQVARLTEPASSGYSVLHEGEIGMLGEGGLKELTYDKALKNYDPATERAKESYQGQGGWLGFTDQYWAAVLVPDPSKAYTARFFGNEKKQFYTDYLEQPLVIEAGQKQSANAYLFAGAKEVSVLNHYQDALHIDRFNKLIDWGWFEFLTKPMLWLMDHLYKLVGNFGIAILLTTVLVKLAFFPLANKSYASMSKMKLLQPEMKKIQARFKEDRGKQQQALMELYKKEKVNPMAGCLPIFLQIPVFFSLYKVLLINIDMRHAPFFGWIRDLSAPDPTSIFNLFGLLPFTAPTSVLGLPLAIGVLPLILGLSMWVQMKLNPTPPDPVQQQVMTYMPVLFTFMLSHFPAGLVVYWTWNNLLSFSQQAIIMKRQGVDVDILENLGLKKLNNRRLQLQTRLKNPANSRTRSPAE